jgi:hypothetical protein
VKDDLEEDDTGNKQAQEDDESLSDEDEHSGRSEDKDDFEENFEEYEVSEEWIDDEQLVEQKNENDVDIDNWKDLDDDNDEDIEIYDEVEEDDDDDKSSSRGAKVNAVVIWGSCVVNSDEENSAEKIELGWDEWDDIEIDFFLEQSSRELIEGMLWGWAKFNGFSQRQSSPLTDLGERDVLEFCLTEAFLMAFLILGSSSDDPNSRKKRRSCQCLILFVFIFFDRDPDHSVH